MYFGPLVKVLELAIKCIYKKATLFGLQKLQRNKDELVYLNSPSLSLQEIAQKI
jgi:hypothetical protein